MPIVYIHGVAVRDHQGALNAKGNPLLERLLENIQWSMVEEQLRRFIAPEIADDPDTVLLLQAYWGDLASQLAWGGASCLPDMRDPAPPHFPPGLPNSPRAFIVAEMRQALNQLGALFFGDVFFYLKNRGDADEPGPIPLRVLDTLAQAQSAKEATGEPIIVLSNSMGGQIMYDIVTYFLPKVPRYAGIKVDYWCSVASQVGLFEEMKLFLSSSSAYGKDKGNRVPFPDRRHLGVWWNVWDVDDVISYSAADIIEGVEDTPFRVGQMLLKEHIGYLREERFYRLFAERIRRAFPRKS